MITDRQSLWLLYWRLKYSVVTWFEEAEGGWVDLVHDMVASSGRRSRDLRRTADQIRIVICPPTQELAGVAFHEVSMVY